MTQSAAKTMDIGIPGRPQKSTEEAVVLVKEQYGIDGTAKTLPSNRDQNFLITCQDGSKAVLKIANADTDEALLRMQEIVMSAAATGGLPVQTVRPALSGETLLIVPGQGGESHFVRVVSFLHGFTIADAKPQSMELLFEVGEILGKLDRILAELDGTRFEREFPWDVQYAGQTIRTHRHRIEDSDERKMVDRMLALFDEQAVPLLESLPRQLIHDDANDYNILVQLNSHSPEKDLPAEAANTTHHVSGLLDFGDLSHSVRIGEVAIACAYLMLDKQDPIAAAGAVAAGYHSVNPLSAEEIEALYPLICSRLGISVCMAAFQRKLESENEYLTISQEPVWALLHQLVPVHPRKAWYRIRAACGLMPFPGEQQLTEWLRVHSGDFAPLLTFASCRVFDFSVASTEWTADELLKPGLGEASLFARLAAENIDVGVGRYNEARLVYTTPQFSTLEGEQRTVHLGLDLFQVEGSTVFAPLDGTVHWVRDNDEPGDYGPTVLLRHEPAGGPVFFTLYGHLSGQSLSRLQPGQTIGRSDPIGELGGKHENGGWAPHVHFQIIGEDFDSDGNFPGVASPSERDFWLSVCPDANLICTIPESFFPPLRKTAAEITEIRKRHMGPSLSLSYENPLHIVRGYMQHLYDADGRQYLDGVNNVPHVGHSNPRVVEAGYRQFRTLTTNTRYLHENIAKYAERLTATMPPSLSVVYFVNSGSEANDLALRIAQAHTGARHTVVIDGAYHGNLASLTGLSPYKYNGPGGAGPPPTTHAAMMPDVYRGPNAGENAGPEYASELQKLLAEINESGESANFIAESALSCGGQIFFPPGYLSSVYPAVRAQGGVCIADEVQVGMGRFGTHFWGFQAESVVPDIVTIGKPVGNGHPLGAVVTTPELAQSFDCGMEYFNTFGGNPVSCAIGLAVLDVLESDGLQEHALNTGNRLLAGLNSLAERHSIVGDVRGRGLFLGIEFVRNRVTKAPAVQEAHYIVNRMKEKGILLSTDGPLHNVIKIKPPLVFTFDDADRVLAELDRVLGEDVVRAGLE